MDIENIKANAPQGAVYWSPAVEQYFDRQFMNIAFKSKGKFVQVDKEYRHELIPIDK